MYVPSPSQREEYQRIILRKEQDIRRWVSKNLDGSERYNITRTHDGIGMRVAILSIRAKELLLRLHREELFTFSEPTLSLDEQGVWTAWFGYSEPAQSPHYILIQ